MQGLPLSLLLLLAVLVVSECAYPDANASVLGLVVTKVTPPLPRVSGVLRGVLQTLGVDWMVPTNWYNWHSRNGDTGVGVEGGTLSEEYIGVWEGSLVGEVPVDTTLLPSPVKEEAREGEREREAEAEGETGAVGTITMYTGTTQLQVVDTQPGTDTTVYDTVTGVLTVRAGASLLCTFFRWAVVGRVYAGTGRVVLQGSPTFDPSSEYPAFTVDNLVEDLDSAGSDPSVSWPPFNTEDVIPNTTISDPMKATLEVYLEPSEWSAGMVHDTIPVYPHGDKQSGVIDIGPYTIDTEDCQAGTAFSREYRLTFNMQVGVSDPASYTKIATRYGRLSLAGSVGCALGWYLLKRHYQEDPSIQTRVSALGLTLLVISDSSLSLLNLGTAVLIPPIMTALTVASIVQLMSAGVFGVALALTTQHIEVPGTNAPTRSYAAVYLSQFTLLTLWLFFGETGVLASLITFSLWPLCQILKTARSRTLSPFSPLALFLFTVPRVWFLGYLFMYRRNVLVFTPSAPYALASLLGTLCLMGVMCLQRVSATLGLEIPAKNRWTYEQDVPQSIIDQCQIDYALGGIEGSSASSSEAEREPEEPPYHVSMSGRLRTRSPTSEPTTTPSVALSPALDTHTDGASVQKGPIPYDIDESARGIGRTDAPPLGPLGVGDATPTSGFTRMMSEGEADGDCATDDDGPPPSTSERGVEASIPTTDICTVDGSQAISRDTPVLSGSVSEGTSPCDVVFPPVPWEDGDRQFNNPSGTFSVLLSRLRRASQSLWQCTTGILVKLIAAPGGTRVRQADTSPEQAEPSLDPHDPLTLLTCPVCLGRLSHDCRVWVTPCNHVYHRHCLRGWINQHRTCPYCRADLPVCYE
ncbi:hypothetical protein KIPB_000232 [Kipferlia bialata]|uniref:RING-type E3 ubiquitin transferase n=1 Tax=Kipferlia bialata TaxID=797122 RepID=A0A9K3GET2_9EUKA|nr:hypothetical protein KIPB_000232 [Kipferlia bialata]|eukprot:g232.t1